LGTRLFIGNLPYEISNEELTDELSQLGHTPSEVKVIIDRDTGRGRGFAFAEFGTEAATSAALGDLNGAMVGGRTLKVDRATERPSRGGGGGGGGGGAAAMMPPKMPPPVPPPMPPAMPPTTPPAIVVGGGGSSTIRATCLGMAFGWTISCGGGAALGFTITFGAAAGGGGGGGGGGGAIRKVSNSCFGRASV
jgi:RNA recognition motif-containing protein